MSKIYGKRDDFDFDIVNIPFLDGDIPRATSYGFYISQFIRFARVSSHDADFNTRNQILTAKLLKQRRNYVSDQFSKSTIRYKRIGYNMNVMRLTACLKEI